MTNFKEDILQITTRLIVEEGFDYSEAKQKLFQNRFNQIDLNDPDSYLTKICPGNVDLKKPMVHHQVYSSGEYGNWY